MLYDISAFSTLVRIFRYNMEKCGLEKGDREIWLRKPQVFGREAFEMP